MYKNCCEFEVQLLINGEFAKELKRVRVIGDDIEKCEEKIYNHYNSLGVKVVDIYRIENYLILE